MKRILSKTRRKTMMVVFLIMLAGSFFTNLIASENSADGLFQGSTITGKVTTVDGEELPGVNIIIKGTTIGTVTDVEGNFIIDVPDEHLSGDIQVSFVGYLTETVSIAGQTVINVSLVPDLQQLEEVVVIGYGVQKKSDLTGAIASVSGEDLTAIPAIGVDQALQGRAAGVSVTSNTGMPGGGVNIQIRGISSINGTQPLVIVNGVRGNLNDLNPYDIESVEILKDASSAAIYGATGGNGVIIVKTKSGQKGKLTANFNYYRGWQEPWKKVDMMNKDEYIKTMNIITAQQAIDRDQDYVPFNDRPDTLPDYNWQDMMFRTAIMENYDFSVSGGSEKSDYYLSANYLKQEGIMRESDYERIGFRISSDHRLNKIIEVGENVTFTRAKNIGFEEWEFQNEYNSPMLSVLTMCPYTPQYDEDGEWAIPPFGDDNPQVWLDVLNRTNKNYTVGGLGYVDLNLFKGFVFTTKVNAYNTFTVRDQFTPYYQYSPTLLNDRSRVEKRITQQFGWELQTYANYNKTLADNHNIGLMAGHEASYTKFADIEGERIDLFSEVEEMWYFDASTNVSEPVQIVEGGGWERAEHAYFGRINYDYKGKYLLTFNIRKDYSSRF